jgi:hypothetical protein
MINTYASAVSGPTPDISRIAQVASGLPVDGCG